MSAAGANEITYSGRYNHKVDVKRRVPVPFRWRPEEKKDENGKILEPTGHFMIILWPKHKAGTCLRVLPQAEWDKLLAAIDAMPNSEQSKSVLKRSIGCESFQSSLDSAGRITIPDEMAKAADIASDAVLAGMIDKFEIWNPKRFAQMQLLDNAVKEAAFDLME